MRNAKQGNDLKKEEEIIDWDPRELVIYASVRDRGKTVLSTNLQTLNTSLLKLNMIVKQ